jgi:hypothetical protein
MFRRGLVMASAALSQAVVKATTLKIRMSHSESSKIMEAVSILLDTPQAALLKRVIV